MRIIKPYVEPTVPLAPAEDLYRIVEAGGRTCYLSEAGEGDTPAKFIQRAIKRGHESILEHATISLRFICDRGVSHELVRHRLASYSQESTRYCNYSKGKFGNEITVIQPCWLENPGPEVTEATDWDVWEFDMKRAEQTYLRLLDMGWTPQQARSVLPNSLKTEIVVTMNIRNWRHFFQMRYFGVAGTPHPQMVEVAKMAFDLLYSHYPAFFEDLKKAD